MSTQQFSYFTISNTGSGGFYSSKPDLKEHQLVLQGCFYPRSEKEWCPWDNHGTRVVGKVFVLKNQPTDRKIHWLNPRWGWDRCDNPSQVPAGHAWAWTPKHVPDWLMDYLPQQVA
jgi:hypothetical protein